MRIEIENYFKANYDKNIVLKDFENRNYGFDTIISERNLNLLIEYKQRYFITGKNDQYLKEYDVLIELVQTVPLFQDLPGLTNRNINKLVNAHKINIAIGWFYKCVADRLVFFRYLDDKLFDVIDIDFKFFKQWLMNEIGSFNLQYSGLTTGTINLKLPLKKIPKPFLKYTRKKYA